MTVIQGSDGARNLDITRDGRALTDTISETISSERSRQGKLYGTGTGGITVDSSMSLAPVLWLKNTGTDFMFVHKLIFGWNGGSTNFDRTILSFIKYNVSEHNTDTADASPVIENISLSGSDAAVTDSDASAEKWDGTGTTGMSGGIGGFLQIPNRIAKGNTSINIDGEIILGPGNTMSMLVTPEETGLYNVAIVYYRAPRGGRSDVTQFI